MGVLSRKERDRQLRRSDILKAAEHIFALEGYHKATIRAIAKDAQYATGTVYLHFKDKGALYFALLEEKMKSLLSTLEEKIKQESDARKKLEIFVQVGLVFFENNQDFFRIFVSQGNETLSEAKFLRSPTGLQMQEYARSILKEAQEQGIASKDFDAGQLAEVFIAIIKTIVLKWLQEKEEKNKNLADSSVTIFRLFLNGAASK